MTLAALQSTLRPIWQPIVPSRRTRPGSEGTQCWRWSAMCPLLVGTCVHRRPTRRSLTVHRPSCTRLRNSLLSPSCRCRCGRDHSRAALIHPATRDTCVLGDVANSTTGGDHHDTGTQGPVTKAKSTTRRARGRDHHVCPAQQKTQCPRNGAGLSSTQTSPLRTR